MLLYRISKSIYADDLSGTGAGLYGGRWNPKGFPMVYTAGSTSLAILEFLAHNFQLMPQLELTLATIEIQKEAGFEEVTSAKLPKNWNKPMISQRFTQRLGAEFLKGKRAYALKVPSALAPREYNFLLNPNHPAHKKTTIVKRIDNFRLDNRIFGLP